MSNPVLSDCRPRGDGKPGLWFKFTHSDGREEAISCECIGQPYSDMIASEVVRLIAENDELLWAGRP